MPIVKDQPSASRMQEREITEMDKEIRRICYQSFRNLLISKKKKKKKVEEKNKQICTQTCFQNLVVIITRETRPLTLSPISSHQHLILETQHVALKLRRYPCWHVGFDTRKDSSW